LKAIDKFIDIFFKFFAVSALLLMVGLVFYNAILRYFFNTSMPASEELARFAFVWVSFMGIIVANKSRSHVSVTILTDRLKGVSALIVRIMREIVILATMGMIFYGGLLYTLRSNFPTPATNTPFWIITVSLAIMALALLIMTMSQIIRDIKNALTDHFSPKDKAGSDEKEAT